MSEGETGVPFRGYTYHDAEARYRHDPPKESEVARECADLIRVVEYVSPNASWRNAAHRMLRAQAAPGAPPAPPAEGSR